MSKEEATAALADARAALNRAQDAVNKWPVSEPEKTIHLVLVGFQGLDNFWKGFETIPQDMDAWWATQGLRVKKWELHRVNLAGDPKSYGFWELVEGLQDNGLLTMTGNDAWYVFAAQYLGWPIGGTVGGDRLKQAQGEEVGWEGYKMLPGVSFADASCVYTLRYNKPPEGVLYPTGRNNVLGWAAHELCHNVALIPCRCGHAKNCIMDQGCYTFPNAVIGCDKPWVYGPKPGDEKGALVKYGFLERIAER